MLKKILKYVAVFTITFSATIFLRNGLENVTKRVDRVDEPLPSYGSLANTGNKYEALVRLHKDDGSFFCSGVVIDGNYALTAAHCITELGMLSTEKIRIVNHEGLTTAIEAIPVAFDSFRDVGIIKGDFREFKSVKVDFYGQYIKPGMIMISCGFPAGQYNVYCVQLKLYANADFKYRTQGPPIYKGMSGGPVIDANTGLLVGVNSAVDLTSVIISPLVGFLDEVGLQ